MLQQLIQQLGYYFLNPLGLAALLALIPLIIFYLMKPSPEEKIMPSMKFFQDEKKDGRLQKALNIIQRNLMLILHILMVAALATAIANPYIMGDERPESTVIVIDNSASMKPVFEDVKQKAVSKTGDTNTLIVANDESEVVLEKASPSETEKRIEELEIEETGTDITSAIRKAGNYEGKAMMISDFRQTERTGTGVKSLLKTLSASKPLETYSPEKENRWGVVDLEINRENATAFIQNYRKKSASPTLEIGEDRRTLELGPEELRKISFNLQEGENTLKLEADGFSTDNNAYVYKPDKQKVQVTVIGQERNKHLMKAFELIETIDAEYIGPSEKHPETDVYIIDKVSDQEQVDFQKIVSEVEDGKSVVLYAQQGASDISGLPVKSLGEAYNTSVDVDEPVELETGNITIYRSEVAGESVSDPEEALKFGDIKDGEFIYFNFASKEFRRSLDYPVFWKNLVEQSADLKSIEEANRKTGSNVLAEQKTFEIKRTGFNEIEGDNYGSNLLNGDESRFKSVDPEYSSTDTVEKPQSLQTPVIGLIILLGITELIYLSRRGEIP